MAKQTSQKVKVAWANHNLIRLSLFRVRARGTAYTLVVYFNQRTKRFEAHCDANGFRTDSPTLQGCIHRAQNRVATHDATTRRLLELSDYFTQTFHAGDETEPAVSVRIELWEEYRFPDGTTTYVRLTEPGERTWQAERPVGLLLLDCPESRKLVKALQQQFNNLRKGLGKRLRGKGPSQLVINLPCIPKRLIAYGPFN